MKTPLSFRQGDVALVRIGTLPANLTAVPLDRGRIVLAYGEVTGHAHAIADHGISEAAYDGLASRDVLAAAASTWRNADGSLHFKRPEMYQPAAES